MNFPKLKKFLQEKGEPGYRYNQIVSDVVSGRVNSYEDVFTIPKRLREELKEIVPLSSYSLKDIKISKDKKAYKALLKLFDGNLIETVLLNPKPELWSICISCQVGYAMNCSFCATGKMGFIRSMTTEEICDQILFWRQYIASNQLKIHISNIVYMGMGEPFANKEEVFESIRWSTDKNLYGFGQRHLSVSTSGIVPGIKEFTDTFPQVNLAISLHAPTNELRQELMPVAKTHPLDQLVTAMQYYIAKTNRQLFIEYILFEGKNDQDKHAVALGNLITDNFAKQKHLIHVNLIVYNPIQAELRAASQERVTRFKQILEQFRIAVTIRKSLGQEVEGACGQLSTASKKLPGI